MKMVNATLREYIRDQVKGFLKRYRGWLISIIIISFINAALFGVFPIINLLSNQFYYFNHFNSGFHINDFYNFLLVTRFISSVICFGGISFLLFKFMTALKLPDEIALCFPESHVTFIRRRAFRFYSYSIIVTLLITIDVLLPWIYQIFFYYQTDTQIVHVAKSVFLSMSLYYLFVLIGYIVFIELTNWMFRKYDVIKPVWYVLFVSTFIILRFITFI